MFSLKYFGEIVFRPKAKSPIYGGKGFISGNAVILLEILPKEEEFLKYLYYKNEITSY